MADRAVPTGDAAEGTEERREQLPDQALDERLDRLAELIGNAPVNLVSAAERAQVRARHLEEAVAIAEALPCRAGQRWMDLGTGGGVPGLVLAACHPDVSWTLLDSTRKKTALVESFARELRLPNVEVVTGRAETLGHAPEYRGRFDGVVSRAVAALPVLLELACGFVRPGGLVAAVKGPTWRTEVQAAGRALELLRFGPVHSHELPSEVRSTWLVTIPSQGAPPRTFPRRDGVPRADPLL